MDLYEDEAQEDPSDLSICSHETSEYGSPVESDGEPIYALPDDVGVPWVPPRGARKMPRKIVECIREGAIGCLLPSRRRRIPRRMHMARRDVQYRVNELFGYEGRDIQIDTIWDVGCRSRSQILVAKTGIGKSLIFEAVPLLDPSRPGIALIVMPTKHIQWQQLDKVNQIEGARAVVYDADHKDAETRYRIAAGHFTHGRSTQSVLYNVIRCELF